MRVLLAGVVLVAASGLSSRPLVAQETLTLSLVDAGQPPASPVTVQVVEQGRARATGTTDAAAIPAADGTTASDFSAKDFGVGLTLNVNFFSKASDVAGDALGVTSADADTPTIGVGGNFDWFARRSLGLRLGVGYASYSVTQRGPAFQESGADVSLWSAGVGPTGRVTFGQIELQPWFMAFLFRNSVDVRTVYGAGAVETDSRDESGLRFGLGADLNIPIGRSLGLLGRAGYYFGDSGDADTHFQLGVGLAYRFGARGY